MKKIKASFVGKHYIGKTSIINRIIADNFNEVTGTTVGVDFFKVDIDAGETGIVQFNIIDAAYQESYVSIYSMLFRDAAIVFIVFDLTNRETFNEIHEFVEVIKNKAPEYVKMVLVGNKADLTNERVVSKEEAEKCANKYGAEFYVEVSAKTGDGVKDLLTRSVLIPGIHIDADDGNSIRIDKNSSNESKSKDNDRC